MIGFEITDIEYSVCLPKTLKNHLPVLPHWAGCSQAPPSPAIHTYTPILSLLHASCKTQAKPILIHQEKGWSFRQDQKLMKMQARSEAGHSFQKQSWMKREKLQ